MTTALARMLAKIESREPTPLHGMPDDALRARAATLLASLLANPTTTAAERELFQAAHGEAFADAPLTTWPPPRPAMMNALRRHVRSLQ